MLVGAFGLWGVADVVRNIGHDTALATVGDRRIEPQEFEQTYRQQLAQVTRMQGNNAELTPAAARSRGAADAAAHGAAGQHRPGSAAASASACPGRRAAPGGVRDPRLPRPERQLRPRHVRAGAAHQRPDRGRASSTLMRADLGSQQLMEAACAGVAAPDTLLKQIYLFQHETRTAETVTLPFAAAPAPPAPTEDDLRRIYENDPAAYTAPAYRRIKVGVLSPQTVARDIEVTDADLHAYYDQHKSEYVTPEKRSAEVLIAKDQAAATKLAEAWRAGADWAAMQKAATDAGASAANLDDATRTEFPSDRTGEAVFSAAPDTVVGPVKSAFGWQVRGRHQSDARQRARLRPGEGRDPRQDRAGPRGGPGLRPRQQARGRAVRRHAARSPARRSGPGRRQRHAGRAGQHAGGRARADPRPRRRCAKPSSRPPSRSRRATRRIWSRGRTSPTSRSRSRT